MGPVGVMNAVLIHPLEFRMAAQVRAQPFPSLPGWCDIGAHSGPNKGRELSAPLKNIEATGSVIGSESRKGAVL